MKASNRRLPRGRKLTEEQLDELSLYCWTLQQSNPTGVLWGRARELWGRSQLGAARGGSALRRRARARD